MITTAIIAVASFFAGGILRRKIHERSITRSSDLRFVDLTDNFPRRR